MRRLAAAGVAVVVFLAGLMPLVAAAQEASERGADPKYLSLSAGFFDVAENNDGAADFRLEYRHDRAFWYLKPWAGIELTSDGALWGGGGALLDIPLERRFIFTGMAGAGGYEEGQGKDLGSTIMFRSQVEVAYRFPDRSRLALGLSYLSNASLRDENPGVEVLSLYYHLPLHRLTGALTWQ